MFVTLELVEIFFNFFFQFFFFSVSENTWLFKFFLPKTKIISSGFFFFLHSKSFLLLNHGYHNNSFTRPCWSSIAKVFFFPLSFNQEKKKRILEKKNPFVSYLRIKNVFFSWHYFPPQYHTWNLLDFKILFI